MKCPFLQFSFPQSVELTIYLWDHIRNEVTEKESLLDTSIFNCISAIVGNDLSILIFDVVYNFSPVPRKHTEVLQVVCWFKLKENLAILTHECLPTCLITSSWMQGWVSIHTVNISYTTTITYFLKNRLNHSIWLSNLISYPKPQYKHTMMTTISHLVFQFDWYSCWVFNTL